MQENNFLKIEELKELITKKTKEELVDLIEYFHPADILDFMHEYEDLKYLFYKIPDETIAEVLEYADEDKFELLSYFSDMKKRNILKAMAADELADFVGELEEERKEKVLSLLSQNDKKEVIKLMNYGPETAGGIMTTEFVSIPENITVEQTLRYLQKDIDDAETAYYLFVVDYKRRLKGVVSLRELVSMPFDTYIAEILNPNVVSVDVHMDQEQVANIFDKYSFLMVPVVDEDNKMLGIITVDDILEIIQDETTEDIHRLAQIDSEEKVDSTILESLKSRLPWLIINLATALLSAFVISNFESTINKVVALAAIMPIITGMGGNAGTQAMTIIIRGISLERLTKENAKIVLFKEIMVGITVGAVIGIFVTVVGLLLFGLPPIFGFASFLAVLLNMTAATAAGYFIPIFLKKIGIDPALASGVFVTTVTDTLGFFLFLGFSSIVIQYFM